MNSNQTNSTNNQANQFSSDSSEEALTLYDGQLLDPQLPQKHIDDLDLKNYTDDPSLLLALRMSRPYSYIVNSIKAGCSVNSTNKFGQNSLHVALVCSTLEILHELIKSGADINFQDDEERTPLHYAIYKNNLEAVCMLLCYGADVSVICKYEKTPLNFAVSYQRYEIAEVLLNYYDNFLDPDVKGFTSLDIAIWMQSPFAKILIKAGADVNYIACKDYTSLTKALENKDFELFELIWPRFDQDLLINEDYPLILQCLMKTTEHYESPSHFFKFMSLIFESPKAVEIMEEFYNCNLLYGSFQYLLVIFDELDFNLNDRIKIISMFLSLGLVQDICDINLALISYGFNEEFEMFLYTADFHSECQEDNDGFRYLALYPQCFFIFSIEDDADVNIITDLFRVAIECVPVYNSTPGELATVNSIIQNLRFFSIPFHKKQELLENCTYWEIRQKLESLPEFPSLVELSRNQARNFIKRSFNITKAYQFHDIVKRMPLPNLICDILRFKTPIY